MPDEQSSTPHIDDEYKNAIQPVVDNNFRTDVLGPHFVKVLENHTPVSDSIIKLITKKICEDPKLKKAVKEVIAEHNKETKMKWVDRGTGAVGVIILSIVIWGLQKLLSN